MFLHHLTIALRSLYRRKMASLINITGLSVGMAAGIFLLLWVQNELRFDTKPPQAAKIWRLVTDLKISPDETWHWGSTPFRLAELVQSQLPEIEATALINNQGWSDLIFRQGANQTAEKKYAYVGPGWFNLFPFPVHAGSLTDFGRKPDEVVLTLAKARQYFGRNNPLGQSITINNKPFTVRAILEDPAPNSSFTDPVYLPIEAYLAEGKNRENEQSWNNFNYSTFVQLREDADPVATGARITALLQKAKTDSTVAIGLTPLSGLHFDTSIQSDAFEKGSMANVRIFGLVGLLILLMAGINYISLTTAQAGQRAREVGIRKVAGAGPGYLLTRYLAESGLIIGVSMLLALTLVGFFLPAFNRITDHHFALDSSDPAIWAVTLGTGLFLLLTAGVYPAWVMLRFRPVDTLKGQLHRGKSGSGIRQALVVFQFAVSAVLLTCTLVIGRQRAFIQHRELGLQHEQILSFTIPYGSVRQNGKDASGPVRRALLNELRQQPGVRHLCMANSSPLEVESTHSGSVDFDGRPSDFVPTVHQLSVDADFPAVFEPTLLEGRWFLPDQPSDRHHVILNETAARSLKLQTPWIGQRFNFHGDTGQVIGVVKDFHLQSLQERIAPLVIFNDENSRSSYFLRMDAGKAPATLSAIAGLWNKYIPDRPFEYKFLDETFDTMYRTEARAERLFSLFAGIGILISCLGLFGLAAFSAGQRTKEIGIRKVLGASARGIVGLLSGEFLQPVVIALLLAVPVAWYCMNSWLQDFAYHVPLDAGVFAVSALIALAISLLTTGFQSLKAALTNPVDSLRSE